MVAAVEAVCVGMLKKKDKLMPRRRRNAVVTSCSTEWLASCVQGLVFALDLSADDEVAFRERLERRREDLGSVTHTRAHLLKFFRFPPHFMAISDVGRYLMTPESLVISKVRPRVCVIVWENS